MDLSDNITARDLMQEKPVCVKEKLTLKECFDVLSRNRISGAPVLSEEGKLTGVISQSDLIRSAFIDSDVEHNAFFVGYPYVTLGADDVLEQHSHKLVGQLMTNDIICAMPGDSISSIAAKMTANRIHRVLIAEDSELLGIVTSMDLLKLLENN